MPLIVLSMRIHLDRVNQCLAINHKGKSFINLGYIRFYQHLMYFNNNSYIFHASDVSVTDIFSV